MGDVHPQVPNINLPRSCSRLRPTYHPASRMQMFPRRIGGCAVLLGGKTMAEGDNKTLDGSRVVMATPHMTVEVAQEFFRDYGDDTEGIYEQIYKNLANKDSA